MISKDKDTYSLTLRKLFVLLGPNGAGKTTLLNAIAGLREPEAGQFEALGVTDVVRLRQRMGVSLQATAFFDDLTLWELVQFYAGMYRVKLDKRAAVAMLAGFGLDDKAGRQARQLSGGEQKRLSLTIALVNDPELVLLDEPTAGLDPHARRDLWALIRRMKADGRTVILTTHLMDEAQELADRVAIMDKGRIVAVGTPDELIARLPQTTTMRLRAGLPVVDVEGLVGVRSVAVADERLTITTDSLPATLAALHTLADQHGHSLRDLQVKQADLEDVFFALTGHTL